MHVGMLIACSNVFMPLYGYKLRFDNSVVLITALTGNIS